MPQMHLQGGARDRISSATTDIRESSANARRLDPVSLAGLGGALGNTNPFGQLGGLLAKLIMGHVGPLKKALDRVTLDQGAAQALAERWQSQFPQALSQQQDQLARLREQVAEHWQGQGAPQAFADRQAALEDLGDTLMQACAEAGALTAKANDLLSQARNQIEEWIGDLIGSLAQRLAAVAATFWIPIVGELHEAVFLEESIRKIVTVSKKIEKLIKRVEEVLHEIAQAGLGIGHAMGGVESLIASSKSAAPTRKPALDRGSGEEKNPASPQGVPETGASMKAFAPHSGRGGSSGIARNPAPSGSSGRGGSSGTPHNSAPGGRGGHRGKRRGGRGSGIPHNPAASAGAHNPAPSAGASNPAPSAGASNPAASASNPAPPYGVIHGPAPYRPHSIAGDIAQGNWPPDGVPLDPKPHRPDPGLETTGTHPFAGTHGGGTFENKPPRGHAVGPLPTTDSNGKPITYTEYDANPHYHLPGNPWGGRNERPSGRDAQRIVRGSDGSMYYTDDHYTTFYPL